MGFDELLSQQKQRKNSRGRRPSEEREPAAVSSKRNLRRVRGSDARQPKIILPGRQSALPKENRKKPVPPVKIPETIVPVVMGPADPTLLAVMYALIGFGLVMVYSASAVYADRTLHDANALIRSQLLHAVMAGAAAWVIGQYGDYRWLRRITYPLLAITLAMLIATVAGYGKAAGGAARWLAVGNLFRIQPAEIAKLAVICWLADSLAKKREQIRTLSIGFVPHAVGTALFAGLCLLQPDFGSAAMILVLLFVMLFIAGAPLGYLLGFGFVLASIAKWVVEHSDYRKARIKAFESQYANFQMFKANNYQLFESQLSFGAGGVNGVGIGNSHQKLMYLPEAHTDFISSIVAEELGLIGFSAMMIAFLYLVYRGVRTGLRCPDTYGTYLCIGISLFIGMQAFTNLAVAVGVFPTKGLVLPFISFGGSSLLVNCCAVGLLSNVSRLQRADTQAPQPTTTRAAREPTKRIVTERERDPNAARGGERQPSPPRIVTASEHATRRIEGVS
jgi:cell division protein FtsW